MLCFHEDDVPPFPSPPHTQAQLCDQCIVKTFYIEEGCTFSILGDIFAFKEMKNKKTNGNKNENSFSLQHFIASEKWDGRREALK